MMRRDFIEKVRLGHHKHLLNAFWQILETWIIQYARIHGPLHSGVLSSTPFLDNSPKSDLFQEFFRKGEWALRHAFKPEDAGNSLNKAWRSGK